MYSVLLCMYEWHIADTIPRSPVSRSQCTFSQIPPGCHLSCGYISHAGAACVTFANRILGPPRVTVRCLSWFHRRVPCPCVVTWACPRRAAPASATLGLVHHLYPSPLLHTCHYFSFMGIRPCASPNPKGWVFLYTCPEVGLST